MKKNLLLGMISNFHLKFKWIQANKFDSFSHWRKSESLSLTPKAPTPQNSQIHSSAIRRQFLTNCFSVFDHLVGLVFKGLRMRFDQAATCTVFSIRDLPFSTYTTLREKCPNTEFFRVHIFAYADWIRENTDQEKRCIWTLFTYCKGLTNFISYPLDFRNLHVSITFVIHIRLTLWSFLPGGWFEMRMV